MSFEDEAARLQSISDPGKRARAAAGAAQDAARMLRAIELAALHDLVNAHGGLQKHGAATAAARELGRSAEAVRKRLTAAPDEAEAYEQEGEPGRYFDSSETAYDALLDWQLQQRDVTARRDPLVRGALAAGLAPRVVRDVTGVTLDTIDRLESTSAGTAVDVPLHVWEETVGYLADLAPQFGRYSMLAHYAARGLAGVIGLPVDETGRLVEPPGNLRGPAWEALSPEQRAEEILSTEWPEGSDAVPEAAHQDFLDGPDGWAAVFCAQAEETAGSQDEDMAAVTRRLAAVIRHVRLTATLPSTGEENHRD